MSKRYIIYIIIGIVVTLLVFYAILCCSIKDPSERGTFGDAFGAVNALFSGLAFAGMILELNLQRKDLNNNIEALKAQRDEMQRQSQEMEDQKNIMAMQQKVSDIQCFENMLFHLLAEQRKILDGLYMMMKNPVTIPHEKGVMLKVEGLQLLNEFRFDLDNLPSYYNVDCSVFYERTKHYFTHLYQVFAYIDSSSLIREDSKKDEMRIRYKYTSMVRDGLSRIELELLYYVNLSNAHRDFKDLFEKYALFHHLRYEWKDLEEKASGYKFSHACDFQDNE